MAWASDDSTPDRLVPRDLASSPPGRRCDGHLHSPALTIREEIYSLGESLDLVRVSNREAVSLPKPEIGVISQISSRGRGCSGNTSMVSGNISVSRGYVSHTRESSGQWPKPTACYNILVTCDRGGRDNEKSSIRSVPDGSDLTHHFRPAENTPLVLTAPPMNTLCRQPCTGHNISIGSIVYQEFDLTIVSTFIT